VDIADRIGAEQTYFTHMTHDIMHADLDARLPESMHLSYDGLVLGVESPEVKTSTESLNNA
jgi:phosphoribosyl 1,2-cyclic phosphate phosphodiesterase